MTETPGNPPANTGSETPPTPPANTGAETPAWASSLNDAINSIPEKLAQMMPAPKDDTPPAGSGGSDEHSEDLSFLDADDDAKPAKKPATKRTAPPATPPVVTPPAAKSARQSFVEWFGHP